MKKVYTVVSALLVIMLLAGCGGTPQTDNPPATQPPAEDTQPPAQQATEPPEDQLEGEIIVFAAASMTEALDEIAELFREVAPGVTVVYNFDSSGTLKTQIQEGAECDIFISAGQKQMNELDISSDANPDGLDFVLQGSRFNIVANKVVMIVPEGSDKDINDFSDVLTDKVSLIALGNSDVPVGQYSEEIYTYLGVWEDLVNSGKVSYGSNVKEVLSQVEAGAVDCGIVYSTDAATATGIEIAAEAPAESHAPITYPAAMLNISKNQAAVEAFIEFLKGPESRAVLVRIGFTIPQ